jgi:hypothetical protein
LATAPSFFGNQSPATLATLATFSQPTREKGKIFSEVVKGYQGYQGCQNQAAWADSEILITDAILLEKEPKRSISVWRLEFGDYCRGLQFA